MPTLRVNIDKAGSALHLDDEIRQHGRPMHRVRIKICGLTTEADVANAVRAGADALGFVFVQASPRYVSPERARELVAQVPAFVSTVGLFVNASAAEMARAVETSGVGCVQLHGDEPPELGPTLGLPWVKALRVGGANDIAAQAARYGQANALLFDTWDPHRAGGTGQKFDWSALDALPAGGPMRILAGGLTPDNVADAIRCVRPYAVDVSGGVERAKGLKDAARMEQFARAVHHVSYSQP